MYSVCIHCHVATEIKLRFGGWGGAGECWRAFSQDCDINFTEL